MRNGGMGGRRRAYLDWDVKSVSLHLSRACIPSSFCSVLHNYSNYLFTTVLGYENGLMIIIIILELFSRTRQPESKSYSNVNTNCKLVSWKTGSVMVNSSPLLINSFNGLSKFPLVAFSNAAGFLIYSVLEDDVTLGDFKRNSPSQRSWITPRSIHHPSYQGTIHRTKVMATTRSSRWRIRIVRMAHYPPWREWNHLKHIIAKK